MSNYHFGPFWKRTLCVALAIAWLFCTALTGSVHAQNRSDSDTIDLILEIKRGSVVLSDAIFALQKDTDDYYLPLLEIASIAGIVADADLRSGTVAGWYFTQGNAYFIDLNKNQYKRGDQTIEIPASHIIIEDFGSGFGEIFIHIDTLNEIWPLALKVNSSAMIAKITTPRKLPFEARQDRLNRWQEFQDKSSESSQIFDDFVRRDNPYRLLSKPAIRLEATNNWNSNGGRPNASLRLQGKSDLLRFSADYNMSWSYNQGQFIDNENTRLKLTRKAYGDETLGIGPIKNLGLRYIELGDIGLRTQPLVGSATNGRGIFVQSKKEQRNNSFDTITIEGSAIPGWEAELYRNNQLITFTTVDQSGRYSFENVELLFGDNIFKTVLYGPSGQIEERFEEHNVASSVLKPGELQYEMGIIDGGNFFLPIANQDNVPDSQVGLGYSGFIARGINRNLSLFASFIQTPTRNQTRSYLSAGANFGLLGGNGRIQLYKEIDNGAALDMRFLNSFKGWRLNMQARLYNDFESNITSFDNNARTADISLSANRSLKGINFTFDVDHQRRENKSRRTEISANQTFRLNKIFFNHRIRTLLRTNTALVSTGRLNNSVRFARYWNLRSTINYQIRPAFHLNDARLQVRYQQPKGLLFGIEANKGFNNDDSISLGLDVGYDFGTFTGSIDTNWKQDQGTNVMLRANTSIAPFGPNGSYIARSQNILSRPALYGRVFHDKNEDGVFDENDEPMPDARLSIQRSKRTQTDENGYFIDYNGRNEGWAAITINQETLDNPFLVPAHPGHYALLRAGSPQYFDIPLIETGSIDGTAYFSSGNPVPGLRVELVDSDGLVIADTITGYDGFYIFELVKPGDYIVRASPSQQVSVPPHAVAVSSEDLYVYGIDLNLIEQVSEVVVADDKATDSIGSKVDIQSDVEVAKTGNEKPAQISTDSNARDAKNLSVPMVPPKSPSERQILSALASALEPKTSMPDASTLGAAVNRVRIGEHPDKLRVSLDLSAPADYRFIRNLNGSVTLVLAGDIRWNTQTSERHKGHDEYRGHLLEKHHDGSLRLLLDLSENAVIMGHGTRELPPFAHNAYNTHEIYVDIKRNAPITGRNTRVP